MTDFSRTLHLDATPDATFAAISDPRSWWSSRITGDTDRLGAEFDFEVPGVHRTRFRITAHRPNELLIWHAEEAWLGFVAEHDEWTGTEVRFEVAPEETGTLLRFTHVGLVPEVECYEACSSAWTSYLVGSLTRRVETGLGDPDQERAGGALEGAAAEARARGGAS